MNGSELTSQRGREGGVVEASQPEVGMIWAQTPTGVIGADNTVPWHVPEDFVHFRQTTHGYPVIMGRATWESLPDRYRPLPGRTNVVLTRQTDWAAPGALVAHTLEEALTLASDADPTPGQVWIVGGSQIYAAALPLAQRLLITTVDTEVFGHAFAPDWEQVGHWELSTRDPDHGWHTSHTGLRYRIEDWHRTEGAPLTA
jgi:dihydrofolate reductase